MKSFLLVLLLLFCSIGCQDLDSVAFNAEIDNYFAIKHNGEKSFIISLQFQNATDSTIQLVFPRLNLDLQLSTEDSVRSPYQLNIPCSSKSIPIFCHSSFQQHYTLKAGEERTLSFSPSFKNTELIYECSESDATDFFLNVKDNIVVVHSIDDRLKAIKFSDRFFLYHFTTDCE